MVIAIEPKIFPKNLPILFQKLKMVRNNIFLSSTFFGTFWVVLSLFSNFWCILATVAGQVKSTQNFPKLCLALKKFLVSDVVVWQSDYSVSSLSETEKYRELDYMELETSDSETDIFSRLHILRSNISSGIILQHFIFILRKIENLKSTK